MTFFILYVALPALFFRILARTAAFGPRLQPLDQRGCRRRRAHLALVDEIAERLAHTAP